VKGPKAAPPQRIGYPAFLVTNIVQRVLGPQLTLVGIMFTVSSDLHIPLMLSSIARPDHVAIIGHNNSADGTLVALSLSGT